MAETSNADTPVESLINPLDQLGKFTKILVSSMEEMSRFADRSISSFLVAFGSILLILDIALRISILGTKISDLTPPEFIALALLSVILILAGSSLRLYQYRTERDLSRSLAEAGTRIIETAIEGQTRITEKGIDAGANMTGTAHNTGARQAANPQHGL